MARKATVWWWKSKGYWVTELGGRRICLAKGWRNKKAAQDKFKQLSKEHDLLAETNGAITVAALCEKFLDDAAENLAPKLISPTNTPARCWWTILGTGWPTRCRLPT